MNTPNDLITVKNNSMRSFMRNLVAMQQMKGKLTLYGPYILESVVYDGFAFIKKGGFPYVKYGNNWHVKG